MTKVEDEQIHKNPWDIEAAAYARLLKDVKNVRGDVLRIIAKYSADPQWRGLTDREIDDLCEMQLGPRGRETYRKRRPELLAAGIVEASGEIRRPKTVAPTSQGQCNEQRVWRIVAKETVEKLAKGDLGGYLADTLSAPSKKKKSPPQSAMPSETQSRLILAHDALLKIKATLEDYRLNSLEDTLWRYACEGLGLDPAREARDD